MTVEIRPGYTAAVLRQMAKTAVTPDQARRLLAMALVCEGKSRAEAARAMGTDRQTLCDRAHRFNWPRSRPW